MVKRRLPCYKTQICQISILENYMKINLKTKSVKEKIKYHKEKLQNNYWDLINLIAYKIEILGKYIKILDNEEEKIKIKKILKQFEKYWIKFKKDNLINFEEEGDKLELYKILMFKLIKIDVILAKLPHSLYNIDEIEQVFTEEFR